MAKVDAKICRIKEVYRAEKNSLAWELPELFVQDLVAYVVSHINMNCSMALSENAAPKVVFIGIPVYYQDAKLAFGDYVEAHKSTNNTSRPHIVACIALRHAVG